MKRIKVRERCTGESSQRHINGMECAQRQRRLFFNAVYVGQKKAKPALQRRLSGANGLCRTEETSIATRVNG
jgi:hypothetical protein